MKVYARILTLSTPLSQAGYILILLICTVLYHPPFLQAQTENKELNIRIFDLNNRPAHSTIDLLKPLLSDQGVITADDRLNRLIVRDRKDVLDQIARMLKELDRPAPLVKISVKFFTTSSDARSTVGVGVYRSPRSGVSTHQVPYNLHVSAVTSNVTGQGDTTQTLMVMSGESGTLIIGRELTSVQPYWTFSQQLGLLPPGITFSKVTTGLKVRPQVMGDNIRLTVYPWISYQAPAGQKGELTFNRSAGTVTIRSGDTITLGSSNLHTKLQRQAFGLILGGSTDVSQEVALFTVTAQIIKYPPP